MDGVTAGGKPHGDRTDLTPQNEDLLPDLGIDFNLSAGRCPLALEVSREESHSSSLGGRTGERLITQPHSLLLLFLLCAVVDRLSRQRSYSPCAVARVHMLGLIFIAMIAEGERS